MSAATASLKAATQRDLDLPAADPKRRIWRVATAYDGSVGSPRRRE